MNTVEACRASLLSTLQINRFVRTISDRESSVRRTWIAMPSETKESDTFKKRLSGMAVAMLASACIGGSSLAALEPELLLDPNYPLLDLAKVIPAGPEEKLAAELNDLEQRSGWRVRLLTRNGGQQGPSGEEIRTAWQFDPKTAIVICDPTSPNILQFKAGDEVARLLKRGFFIELQSRFGNIFFVRQEGEDVAVLSAVGAISSCLEQGGCAVVPGLPYNQYQLTLITSIIGGFIFGYSTTIRNQGFIQRRFLWPLLFAPLWGTLFISFGLGPILTRTQDKLPLIQNLAAFLVAAAIFRLSPMFKPGTVNLDLISKEGREKQDAKDMRDD